MIVPFTKPYRTYAPLRSLKENEELFTPAMQSLALQYADPVRIFVVILSRAKERLLMPVASPCVCLFTPIITRQAPVESVMMMEKRPTATISSISVYPCFVLRAFMI